LASRSILFWLGSQCGGGSHSGGDANEKHLECGTALDAAQRSPETLTVLKAHVLMADEKTDVVADAACAAMESIAVQDPGKRGIIHMFRTGELQRAAAALASPTCRSVVIITGTGAGPVCFSLSLLCVTTTHMCVHSVCNLLPSSYSILCSLNKATVSSWLLLGFPCASPDGAIFSETDGPVGAIALARVLAGVYCVYRVRPLQFNSGCT
jgi:hypothetical protein